MYGIATNWQTTWEVKQQWFCGVNWMPHLVAEWYQHHLNLWPCFCHQGSRLWNVQSEGINSLKSCFHFMSSFSVPFLFPFVLFFSIPHCDVVCYCPVTPMIVFMYITFVWFCVFFSAFIPFICFYSYRHFVFCIFLFYLLVCLHCSAFLLFYCLP